MADILLINGPNLSLLGTREPSFYGSDSLQKIEDRCAEKCHEKGFSFRSEQSNSESVLIDHIHAASADKVKFILINAGGLTHTSIAIRDALLAVEIPFIEIHSSNVWKRETFRHKSYLSDIAVGVISGLKAFGYYYALDYAISNFTKQTPSKN